MATTLATIKCPTWCTRRHTQTELEIDDVYHTCTAATSPLGGITIDQMAELDGQPADEPALILLPDFNYAENIDAATARQFGAALLKAADVLDSINAERARS